MEYLYIGKIVNTHGIKGELRLISKFPYKDRAFIHGMPIYINKTYREVINTYRHHKNFDMITLEGYDNINEVLKYKGLNVYLAKDDITLDSSMYLDEDLIGLKVIYMNTLKGKIIRIERYEKTTLIVINDTSREYLIPYNTDLIEKIDLIDKKIYIKNIKGLFE